MLNSAKTFLGVIPSSVTTPSSCCQSGGWLTLSRKLIDWCCCDVTMCCLGPELHTEGHSQPQY